MENWKRYKETCLEVSDKGNIRSIDHIVEQKSNGGGICNINYKGRNRKLQSYNSGYLGIYHNTLGNMMIHRMVAETFLPNPNNYPCVNHKDGNKHNNNVENLEWCSYSQNTKHAIDTGLLKLDKVQVLNAMQKGWDISKHKRRPVTCLETGQIFDCMTDAELFMNPNLTREEAQQMRSIRYCCLGKQKTAYQLHWRWAQ